MTPSPLELLLSGRYRELYALLHSDDARGRLLAEFASAADALTGPVGTQLAASANLPANQTDAASSVPTTLTDRQLELRASGDFSWGLLSGAQRRRFLTKTLRTALTGSGRADAGRGQLRALAQARSVLSELYAALDVAAGDADLDWLLPVAEHLADLQEITGDSAVSLAQYGQLLALAGRIGSPELQLHARLGLSVAHLRTGSYADCLEQAQSAAQLAETLGDVRLLAAALHMAGTARNMLGDFAAAAEQLERALELRRELGETHAIASSLGNLAYARLQLRDPQSARELLQEGHVLCTEFGDLRGAAMFLTNLGALAYGTRNYATGSAHYAAALDALRRLDDPRGVAASLSGIGCCEYGLGNLDAARQSQAESLELAQRINDSYLAYMALNSLGNIEYCAGDYAQSLAHYSATLEVCRASGDRQGQARSRCGMANASLLHGEPRAADLADGLRTFAELGDQTGLIDGLAYGALYLAGSHPAAAAIALQTALAAARAADYEFDRADQLIVGRARALFAEQLANVTDGSAPQDLDVAVTSVIDLLQQA